MTVLTKLVLFQFTHQMIQSIDLHAWETKRVVWELIIHVNRLVVVAKSIFVSDHRHWTTSRAWANVWGRWSPCIADRISAVMMVEGASISEFRVAVVLNLVRSVSRGNTDKHLPAVTDWWCGVERTVGSFDVGRLAAVIVRLIWKSWVALLPKDGLWLRIRFFRELEGLIQLGTVADGPSLANVVDSLLKASVFSSVIVEFIDRESEMLLAMEIVWRTQIRWEWAVCARALACI